MHIRNCTKEDFDQMLEKFDCFWEGDDPERLNRLRNLHHPMMLYELGDNAFVIKENGQVLAYLFGVFSKMEPLAYVHLITTHYEHRRKRLATSLYEYFIAKAKQNGCKFIKAITSSKNERSIGFHKSMGMVLQGEPNEAGIPVVRDYAGPGQDRVVFLKSI